MTARTAVEAAPVPGARADGVPGRDRWLDLLRALALLRVVVYHVFGWAWLTVLFPSMGVMFALAGSLMARSLRGRPADAVVRGRLRRLLPPVWLFAAVVVPLMFLDGWDPERTGTRALELLHYLVPVGAPPFPWQLDGWGGRLDGAWADQAAGPLWYVRTYLWLVVASPLLLWSFRRAPWTTLCAPLVLTAVVGGGGLLSVPGGAGDTVTDFVTYASCWVLGFAHREGLLGRTPRYLVVSCASFLMAFGLWWAAGHLGPEGWNLGDIPLAQAAWSAGYVAILLRYAPAWRGLPARLARCEGLVTLANRRAVTLYLWHNPMILATVPLLDLLWEIPFVEAHLAGVLGAAYPLWMFVLVWPLLALAVLAAGWAEDLAARRPVRLWPVSGSHAR